MPIAVHRTRTQLLKQTYVERGEISSPSCQSEFGLPREVPELWKCPSPRVDETPPVQLGLHVLTMTGFKVQWRGIGI